MDFTLTEEQRTLGEVARTILADRCTHERLKQLEADAPYAVFDRELWQHLADAGITGSVVPTDHGGSGLGLFELLGVLEATGEHVAPIPLVPTLVLGALPIARHGTPEQRERWLPGIAAGAVVVAAALEEQGNDDPLEPTVQARPDGLHWQVTGTKLAVPYAEQADLLVVSVLAADGAALALVDPRGEGVELETERTTNRQPVATVTFDRARAEPLILGADHVQRATLEGAAAVCAVQVGVCEAALRMTARHTSQREQFGKPIAEFQAVAQRAADAFIDTEMVRLTAWQAIDALHRDRRDAVRAVHTAKFWAGDGARRVVHAAQHLHGGLGVDLDYPLHRYFVWAKQLEHTLGTPTRELVRLGAVLAVEPS